MNDVSEVCWGYLRFGVLESYQYYGVWEACH